MLTTQNAFAPGISIFAYSENGKWNCDHGWVSPCYGDLVTAPVCSYAQTIEGVQEFVSVILPGHPNRREPMASEARIGNAKIYRISSGDASDLLVLSKSGTVEIDGFQTDFDWSWMRQKSNSSDLYEAVLLSGRRLVSAIGSF